jgi:cobalamin biosynthesis protein CobD/CbiB
LGGSAQIHCQDAAWTKNLFMKYFDNIFICSYRTYRRFETKRDPRFTASALICVCINGITFMIVVLIPRTFNLPKSSIALIGAHPWLAVVFAVVEMFFLYNYYSGKRINTLDANFQQKKTPEKRFWGFMTIVSLVMPTALGALLLNGE